jgi:hypothetical protein
MKSFFEILGITIFSILICILTIFLIVENSQPFTNEEKINKIKLEVSNLPDSYVKRNLMLTIAGEYGGYSEELYLLLKPFSEMKLKEIEK